MCYERLSQVWKNKGITTLEATEPLGNLLDAFRPQGSRCPLFGYNALSVKNLANLELLMIFQNEQQSLH